MVIRSEDLLVYDVEKYPFRQVIEQILGTTKLEALHATVPVFTHAGTDSATPFHKKFYESKHEFLPLYQKFVREFVALQFDEKILYQTVPTFRVHLQHNHAVGEWHRDTDYGHSEKELNFWLPVTDAFQTNTVWIDGEPRELRYGEVLVFQGSRLHGNKLNETGWTKSKFRLPDPERTRLRGHWSKKHRERSPIPDRRLLDQELSPATSGNSLNLLLSFLRST